MQDIRKIIKYSEDEWQAVCKRADFLNMRTGTFIRKIAFQETLKKFDMRKFNQVLVSFHRIGNLLEQILRVSKKEQLLHTSEIQKFVDVYNSCEKSFYKYLSVLKSERLL